MDDEFDTYEEPTIVSTMQETDKKCPQCGGTMDFDPTTGGLKCPYCDYVEEIKPVSDAPEHAVEIALEDAENIDETSWEKDVCLSVYFSPSTVYLLIGFRYEGYSVRLVTNAK